ncbi:hypothetical protein [Halorubrum tibetense]|uniref:Uncharacterized protein n=1 Tax=Halorubrum tibetense TaxID=175631 RepID=A0ABD5SCQ9_9EURY
MYLRDLFVGLLLFGGAGWIASGDAVGSDGVAVGVAILGGLVAGSVYLCSAVGVGIGRELGGTRLTRLRLRAVAQVAIGGSLIVLGVDGSLGSGTGSPLLLPAGIVVVGLGVLLWTRGTGASGSDGSNGPNSPNGSNTADDAPPDRDHT